MWREEHDPALRLEPEGELVRLQLCVRVFTTSEDPGTEC